MAQMTITQFMTGIKNWVLGKIGNITALIPSQASSSNQLADKAFVNSSIATATATFRGTYNVVSDLSLSYNATHAQIQTALATKMSALSITPDNNDYAFVQIPTADATPTQIAKIERYKYSGSAWAFEYELNNSGFTAAQWAAINSGATLELIGKLQALPTNAELTTLLAGKQNVLTFDNAPTENSDNPVKSGGIYSAIATAITNATNAIKEWANGLFAKTNGWYKQLVAGLAENLVSPDGVTNTEPYLFRTSAGSTSIGSGYAQLKKLEGRTVKFNQLVKNGNFANNDNWGLNNAELTTSDNIASVKLTANPEYNYSSRIKQSLDIKQGHKYYMRFECKCPRTGTFSGDNSGTLDGGTDIAISQANTWTYGAWIRTCTNINNHTFSLYPREITDGYVKDDVYYVRNFILIDLTDIFGEGNEPATVEEFESWLATNIGLKSYYPYTEGKLVSVDIDGLETTGFNQWDEQYLLGYYDSTGSLRNQADQLCTRNYIPVIGGKTYYYGTPSAYQTKGNVCYYDSSKNFIIRKDTTALLTIPDGAAYMKLSFGSGYGSTYNHDICINLSWSGYRNGEYEAYWKEKRDLSWIKSLKDTNDNVLFPYGLLSAGSVKDEVIGSRAIKRVGVVDLGSLEWFYLSTQQFFRAIIYGAAPTAFNAKPNYLCANYTTKEVQYDSQVVSVNGNMSITQRYNSNNVVVVNTSYSDADTFKTAMSGVLLYYELETPIEVDIDPEANMYYKVDDWGTEEFTSDSEDVPQTVAPYHTTHYMDNLRDKLRNIDTNFVSATEAQSFTDIQKAQARKNIGAGTVNANDDCPNLVAGLAKNLIDTKGTGSEQMFTRRKSCGEESISDDGNALFKKLLGKSLVWNQVFPDSYSHYQFTGVRGDRVRSGFASIIQNHKYLLWVNGSAYPKLNGLYDTNTSTAIIGSAGSTVSKKIAVASTTSNHAEAWFNEEADVAYDFYMNVIDLTLMFGAGNEPSTVEEFEALFNKPYYAYNAGEIIDNMVESYQTVGFNQWDEEWEVGGIDNDGQPNTSTNVFRSKNFIPVFPSTTYNIYYGSYNSGGGKVLYYYFYDSEKNFIGVRAYTNAKNETVTTPSDARYMKIRSGGNSAQTTYQNDICINLSLSGYRNGEYEPYWKRTLALGLNSFRVTDGTDIITVNGLKSAGTVYDEIDLERKKYIKRVGSVDLGSLTFIYQDDPNTGNRFRTETPNNLKISTGEICSRYSVVDYQKFVANDKVATLKLAAGYLYIKDSSYTNATTFKTAMNGVILYYELAEPVEYDLVDDIQATCQVADFGTEYAAPTEEVDENGVPKSAPFRAMIKYNDDFVRNLVRMPQTYQSQESMDAFLAALGTAMNGTWSKSWDSTNSKYTYTFTPNSSNE